MQSLLNPSSPLNHPEALDLEEDRRFFLQADGGRLHLLDRGGDFPEKEPHHGAKDDEAEGPALLLALSDRTVSLLCGEVLEAAGYRVVHLPETPRLAYAAIDAFPGSLTGIVTDHTRFPFTGSQLAGYARMRHEPLGAVYLMEADAAPVEDWALDLDLQSGRGIGLRKPFRLRELLDAVAAVTGIAPGVERF